jgi:hypothetical protein
MPVSLATTTKKTPSFVQPSGEFANQTPAQVTNRAPASVISRPKPTFKAPRVVRSRHSDEPNFALKREGQDESEKRRLLQALSMMSPEDNE